MYVGGVPCCLAEAPLPTFLAEAPVIVTQQQAMRRRGPGRCASAAAIGGRTA